MRKLNFEEFETQSKEWKEKNMQYRNELRKIIMEGNEITRLKYHDVDAYFLSDDYALFVKQEEKLNKKYKGYVDMYKDPDFYCLLSTTEELDNSSIPNDTKEFVKSNLGNTVSDGTLYGKLIGIALAIDDYYYVIENKKGKNVWISSVIKVVGE